MQDDHAPATMGRWAIQGRNGRVDLRLGPPTRIFGQDGAASDLLTAEFTAELSGPGYFKGAATVRLAALDLVRFHRELGGLVAGRAANATLGSLGDEVGLTLDAATGGGARLSGFVGAGLANAVSFNDVQVERASLVRSYAALESVASEVVGYAVVVGSGDEGATAGDSAPECREQNHSAR
jgi:hypothetical protein